MNICRGRRYRHWPQLTKYWVTLSPIALIPLVSHQTIQDPGYVQINNIKLFLRKSILCVIFPQDNLMVPAISLCVTQHFQALCGLRL